MATLHETIESTKNVFKWIALVMLGITSLVLVFRAGLAVKEFFYPTPPPLPTVEFGKLPALEFPPNITTDTLSYTVDTVTGNLPTFADRLPIHKLVKNTPTLLNRDRAREKVKAIGFTTSDNQLAPETVLSNTLYQWNETNELPRELVMNITTFNFDLSSQYIYYPSVITATHLPDEERAIQTTKDLLERMKLMPEDIDAEKTETQLYTIQDNALVQATSLSTAHVIRVDLFQKDINELPVVYPNPPYSTMVFLIASSDLQPEIVEGHFVHQTIDKNTPSSTYPIKTANEALEQLKKGNGYIASYQGSTPDVIIEEVSLGYYLGDKEQDYLMPVIIFKGNDNFYAYVSAIKEDFIEQSEQ